jgi:RNA polymerase sigma-70 factor (ECF subfamily)
MHLTDAAWLAAARQLDEQALAHLYDMLSPGLFRYAYRLLGDAQSAEDVVSETFHRLLVALRSGGGPRDHVRAYMYRIAHNLAIDQYRRREPSTEREDEQAADVHAQRDPALAAEQSLSQDEAREAIWMLTPEQRQVILLKYFEGLGNRETAEILGKPVGAVKALQHRALRSLGRALERRTAKESER